MKLKVIAQDANGNRWEEKGYRDCIKAELTEQQMLDIMKEFPMKFPLRMLKETPNFFIMHGKNLVLANS